MLQTPSAISLECPRLIHLTCLPKTFASSEPIARIGVGPNYPTTGENALSVAIQRLVMACDLYVEVKRMSSVSYGDQPGARGASLDRLAPKSTATTTS